MTAAAKTTTPLEVTRLAGSLGAEVRGLSLAEFDAGQTAEILELLTEHQVLFFPEQNLSPESHVAFGRHFGKLEGHPNLKFSSDLPELFELRASYGATADEWHSDLTCQDEPSVYAILNMVECPSVGGDTLWSNMYKALEELSPPMQDFLEGLTALHDAHAHGQPEKMAIHPVVRVHPVTGRKSLFVNEHFTRRIVELSHSESDVLLRYLTGWASSHRFTVRYHWTNGTIAMWDNRCTQHYVLDDFEGERIIQRVTVMGDEPSAARSSNWEPYRNRGNLGAADRHDVQLNSYLKSREGSSN